MELLTAAGAAEPTEQWYWTDLKAYGYGTAPLSRLHFCEISRGPDGGCHVPTVAGSVVTVFLSGVGSKLVTSFMLTTVRTSDMTS